MDQEKVKKQLEAIRPGKTYPARVVVKEPDSTEARFALQSYIVGMYCEVRLNGYLADQLCDHNNRTIVRNLKKDIESALKRGAEVEIGAIVSVVTEKNADAVTTNNIGSPNENQKAVTTKIL